MGTSTEAWEPTTVRMGSFHLLLTCLTKAPAFGCNDNGYGDGTGGDPTWLPDELSYQSEMMR